MSTTATELPESFAAGTTVAYRRSHTAYPASDGWALTLYLNGAGAVSAAGVPVGAAFDVTLAAAATAGLPPGAYTWIERVSRGAEVYDAARGTVLVLANVATSPAGALQSWEERTLTVVQAAIDGQLTSGMASYQIHGRAVSKIPLADLVRLRAGLQAAIAKKARGGKSRVKLVHFTGAGFER